MFPAWSMFFEVRPISSASITSGSAPEDSRTLDYVTGRFGAQASAITAADVKAGDSVQIKYTEDAGKMKSGWKEGKCDMK